LALATVGVARSADLQEVTNDGLENRTDTGEEKNKANPVVPYIRCEHVFQRSQYNPQQGY
jgi:hypothetical protein